jgi:uncharacterized protein
MAPDERAPAHAAAGRSSYKSSRAREPESRLAGRGIMFRKGHLQTMDINGSHRFAAAPQQVWDALHNSAILQGCIPGAQQVTWQGDSALSITGGISIGPFNRSGTVPMQVSEQQAPGHMKLTISRSILTATATVDLAPDGGGTNVTYNAHADLSGALGAVEMVAKPFMEGQLRQFFSCLSSKIG